ncbi:hypothetical protein HPP92_000904 [Vanilla planifolia]|uniref:non-specific serine/threonine protein kinase n=1 Tax=Vanilla planifolia TaxID=51239 RepID=A0A835RT14_VANPL|nr:hypothetical protein HPP92_000904 [Vanilla planifolia]
MLSLNFLTYKKNHELNYFHGGISEKITSLPKLRILWAPRGNLVGELPSHWGGCKNLEMVNLGQNHLTGRIPLDLDKCANIRFLDFSMNKLTGWLSEELSVPCMDLFDVSGNQLSGPIPSFIRKQCPLLPIPEDDLLLAYKLFFTYWTLVDFGILSSESIGNHSVYHNFACNNLSGTFSSPVATGRYGKRSVNALKLDRNPISVSLSDREFGKCRKFSVVADLSDNLLSGEIPADNSVKCCPVMVLNLSGNQITGIIPPSIGLLENLVVLDLGGNRLNGEMPVGLSSLKRLKYFSLGNNNFSGRNANALEQLHSLHKLELSSNYLSGISGGLLKLRRLSVIMLREKMVFGKAPSRSANMTSDSIFKILHLQNSSADSSSHYDNNRSQISSNKCGDGFNSIEIAGIASVAALVSVVALLIVYMYARKCMASSSVESSEIQGVTIFVDIGVPLSYESVVRATGNFNASNCIGSGGFGATYKAEVSPGVLVAIKRLSVGRLQGVQQFHTEIKTLGRWRHSNLVTLIGYYGSDTEMFLIYNYLPGGNLERFILERSRRPVDWKMIHKIALNVALALAYLHDQCTPRILHRDVKPSNILLDNDCNAYLSDFGLARLLGNSETHATTGVAGTFGYVAPEYAMTCRVSDKADVYSYGVVLMELLSDKKALDPSFSPYGDGFNIVAWASMLLQQGRINEFFTEGLWLDSSHQYLLETLKLAIRCTEEQLSQRPRMKQVVTNAEGT